MENTLAQNSFFNSKKMDNPQFKENRKQAILKERAYKLSKLTEQKAVQEAIEVIKFKLSCEIYAIELKYIREVHAFKELTLLPCVPAFVCGLINVRRKILSLIDLKYFFDIPREDPLKKKMIILENELMEFALLVDSIVEVCSIAISDIQLSLPVLVGLQQEFLKGISKDGVIILDGEKLMFSKHIVIQD